jgi:uncharacterized protein YjbJ (UPF0337 family)
MNRDSGKLDEAKGRIRKAYGELANDPEQKGKGTIDKIAGKVKQGVGRLQETIKDTMDRSKGR